MTASLRVVAIRFDFFTAVAFTFTCSTGVLASVRVRRVGPGRLGHKSTVLPIGLWCRR
jgi:hypothetical protein